MSTTGPDSGREDAGPLSWALGDTSLGHPHRPIYVEILENSGVKKNLFSFNQPFTLKNY